MTESPSSTQAAAFQFLQNFWPDMPQFVFVYFLKLDVNALSSEQVRNIPTILHYSDYTAKFQFYFSVLLHSANTQTPSIHIT